MLHLFLHTGSDGSFPVHGTPRCSRVHPPHWSHWADDGVHDSKSHGMSLITELSAPRLAHKHFIDISVDLAAFSHCSSNISLLTYIISYFVWMILTASTLSLLWYSGSYVLVTMTKHRHLRAYMMFILLSCMVYFTFCNEACYPVTYMYVIIKYFLPLRWPPHKPSPPTPLVP